MFYNTALYYQSFVFRTENAQVLSPACARENKPTSDMADVLLSLKHAVVHPGQPERYDAQQQFYHPQVLLSPGGYPGICDQNFAQHQAPMFPSMSVNVSMNMTMHGYHPNSNYPAAAEIACPQVTHVPIEVIKKNDYNYMSYVKIRMCISCILILVALPLVAYL